MGCGCNQVRDASLAGKVLKTGERNLVLDEHGMYPLYADRECHEQYHGAFPAATVYIAGRDTEWEKLFLYKDWTPASDYARGNEVDLVHVGVKQLCHHVVEEFLGA